MKITKRTGWAFVVAGVAIILVVVLWSSLRRDFVVRVQDSEGKSISGVSVVMEERSMRPVVGRIPWLPRWVRQRDVTNSFIAKQGVVRFSRITSGDKFVMVTVGRENYLPLTFTYSSNGFRRFASDLFGSTRHTASPGKEADAVVTLAPK